MHADDTPLISVVMSVYNGAPFLAEAIESILGQTYENLEFIITDDGSGDESAAIIRDHAARDSRIRTIFQDHSGIARADNAGVGAAQGEWIARMDQDDIALPQRLEVQLAYAHAVGADICGSLAETFGTERKIYWYPESHEAIRREFLFRFAILQPTVLMKAPLLKEHPYSERTFAADYELWTRLVPLCRMANVPKVLLKYRLHERQTTRMERARFRGDLRRLRFLYFYTLYPHTPLRDYLPLSRLADGMAMPSLADLERAGQWLKDLSRAPAAELGEGMKDRWRRTWKLSTSLGPDGYDVYRRYCDELEQYDPSGSGSIHE